MTGTIHALVRSPSSAFRAWGLLILAAAAFWTPPAGAEMVTRRWDTPSRASPGRAENPAAGGAVVVRFDLSGLPKATTVYRADLLIFRTKQVDGSMDEAMVDIAIHPLFSAFRAGAQAKASGKALALVGPWYDRFDATDAVKTWLAGKTNGGFLISKCPLLDAEATCLEISYEGKVEDPPPAVTGLRVGHRAGQTFITWKEAEDPFGDKPVTLAELKAKREEMEQARPVRYRIYRHGRRIDNRSIRDAELLAEVEPLSGLNVRGVSVDRLIHQHQIRARDDAVFARGIARGPFGGYHRNMPQMGQVVVDRLAVEHGKAVPPGTGLYVHAPAKAGKAHYAVVASVAGRANTRDFSPANSLDEPVDEQVGPGQPVFQGTEKLKVFYDYPGQRRRYVQWTAPPLSNLPNQYHNWGVYLPPAALSGDKAGAALALGVYFHDWRGLYLRPYWPHPKDMVLISPDDGHPRATFAYGYHESLGTLRSFGAGAVGDYTARRMDAFVEWACKQFRIDASRMSCHGSGVYGGTSAIAYALRHPARVALVVAGAFDTDPKSNQPMVRIGNRRRKTHLSALEAVWGKKEWNLKTAGGKSIWDDRDMVAFVRGNPEVPLPFMSLGTGSQHSTWVQENAMLKALWACKQPFRTDFTWGGQAPHFGPMYVRRDRIMLAAAPDKASLPKLRWYNDPHWQKGVTGYWGGGHTMINMGLSWDVDDIVDTPDRLEVSASATGDVTIRNAQKFKLAPGEKVRWQVKGQRRDQDRDGTATADANSLLTLPGLRGRLIVTRMAAEPAKTTRPAKEGTKE